MKFKSILLFSLILFPLYLSEIKAQNEITQFPANYEGHDPAVLYTNLKTLIEQNNLNGKSKKIAKFLKGKKVYKNLTTDDYFAFTLEPTNYEWGVVSGTQNYYRVVTFPLLKLNEFPSPKKKFLLGGMGTGIGIPTISSPLELISEYPAKNSSDKLWTSSYLPITTVFPPESLAKNYIGYKAKCYPSAYTPSVSVCDGIDFTVPSPQIHYGLSFIKKQSLPLVLVENKVLSLETYKIKGQPEPGIAAWVEDLNKKNRNVSPIFIVKLVSPYIETQTFEEMDSVENKPHQAIRNIIYADLVGVWIYERRSGKIISKSGDRLESSAHDLENKKAKKEDDYKKPPPPPRVKPLPSRALRIISKPKPGYTDLARENNTQGPVHLKVTFLASGKIGDVIVIKGLPYGLSEKAVEAAQQIQFSPQIKNGVAQTVTKTLVFNFTIY